jgi:TrmH family RNA methyltransferase
VEAVRATMGSIFALPIARAEFDVFDAWRRQGRLTMLGASLKGAGFAEGVLPGGVVVLMGNEQSGLPPHMEAACEALVKLPMAGRADSLNLAQATAVMLYDVWRRQNYEGRRD